MGVNRMAADTEPRFAPSLNPRSADPIWPHPRWLRRLYVIERANSETIAAEAGVSQHTILDALRAASVSPRSRGWPAAADPRLTNLCWLTRAYRDARMRAIANELGVGASTVARAFCQACFASKPS